MNVINWEKYWAETKPGKGGDTPTSSRLQVSDGETHVHAVLNNGVQ